MSHQTGFNKFPDLRLLKFLGTGILNTVFGYSVYAILLFVSTPYPVALLLATVAGVVFNYISFGRLVFREQGSWIAFGKFVIAYALAYAVNLVLLWVLVAYFGFNPYFAQLACIPPNILLTWLLMNYWVYRND